MRIPSLASRSLLVLMAAAVAAPSVAEAQARRWKDRPHDGYVTAESRYGAARISAPVRANQYGRLQVRLPGGTWIDCVRSCSETLRRETIDFWHIRSDPFSGGTDGVGYLRFRF